MTPGQAPALGIRQATEDDLGAILDIYNHAIETTTAVFTYRPHTIEMRREWLRGKQESGHPVFVALADIGIVGFGTYGPFRAWPAYKYTIEHSVYASPAMRRQGVGRALLQTIVEDARDREYHAIVAGIVADNVPSLRLHESLGFVEVAHFPEVGFKFGRWLDLKFLQLLLPTPDHPVER